MNTLSPRDKILMFETGYFASGWRDMAVRLGLKALDMLREEGLQNVFQRHTRHAEATRRAVRAWGLELVALDPKEFSSWLTAIFAPQGRSADMLRKAILEKFGMPLGAGLGKLQGKAFRIGHLGDFNDLMLELEP